MKNSTLIQYTIGFVTSIALTMLAFGAVFLHDLSNHQILSHSFLQAAVILFAILQMLIQLVLFLHLGKESKPRWNLSAFIFAVLIVAIVVGGTLWIMGNLEHGMNQLMYEGEIAPQNENH